MQLFIKSLLASAFLTMFASVTQAQGIFGHWDPHHA